jgi:hypothetical protein
LVLVFGGTSSRIAVAVRKFETFPPRFTSNLFTLVLACVGLAAAEDERAFKRELDLIMESRTRSYQKIPAAAALNAFEGKPAFHTIPSKCVFER